MEHNDSPRKEQVDRKQSGEEMDSSIALGDMRPLRLAWMPTKVPHMLCADSVDLEAAADESAPRDGAPHHDSGR